MPNNKVMAKTSKIFLGKNDTKEDKIRNIFIFKQFENFEKKE